MFGFNCKNNRQTLEAGVTKNDFQLGLLVLLATLIIAGCGQAPTGDTSTRALAKLNAAWDKSTQTLSVSGLQEKSEESVIIHDASTGALLGAAIVKDDGSWAASATTAACDVHIELPSGTQTVEVQNAPSNCGTSSSIAGRVITEEDIPLGVAFTNNPQPLNTVPNAIILSPPQDMNINVGQTINFSGTAIGNGTLPPYGYFWNFGGAVPNSTIQNPGAVRFDIPGTYFIQLTATDNLGIPDPTPAVRTITVSSPNFPINDTPTPIITSPTTTNGTVSISVGESLFFSGSATDPSGFNTFTYQWDFAGAYPDQFGATAGSVPFFQAGTFNVSLYATNAQGIRSAIPATVTIIVGATAGINQAPTGAIARPRNDVTINAGESLNFRARATDPDNNSPLLYSWDFQGVAPNIFMSPDNSAGEITFSTPGIYYIRMTTTDSLGASDPNPPVRVVTVQNTAVTPPPGNTTLVAQITSPPSDTTISPGQSLFFSGQVFGTTAAQYFWSFDGAAANSNQQTPGNITFSIPGQFNVMFYAADVTGNIIGSPAVITITVADPTNVAANIISPPDNTTVSVGQAINLIGDVGNNSGFSNLSYKWTIKPRGGGNSIFSSNQLSPGQFIFTQAGEFVVRFSARGTDQFGNPTVASRSKSRVTVTNLGNIPPPIGSPGQGIANTGILLPAADMVIYVGNEVDFEANRFTGTDITYNWDFNGQRRPSSRRDPSPFTFDTAGTFFITLQVTGSVNGLPLNVFDQRVITVLAQNPSFPPTSPFPQSTGILLPSTDQVITAGQTVDFEANRVTGTNIDYRWDFSGARSPSSRRNPSPVTFNTPGTFFVTLQVTGTANGLPVNIFDQRVITVLAAAGGFPPTSPFPGSPVVQNAGILLPTTDQVINIGQSVDFEANRVSGTDVNYRWDFSGARSPSSRRNPSPVQFDSPGSFFITLQVTGTDNNGFPINVFDQRAITVIQSGAGLPGNNPIQQGPGITMPVTDAIINAGEIVHFHAATISGNNVNYSWDFNSVRSPSSRRNPGDVQFDIPGSFFITLQVTGTDDNGFPINIFDQRTITVLQPSSPFPGTPQPTPVGLTSGILLPVTDTVINLGESVDFEANRISGDNIVYRWQFSGARSPSSRRNPSPVTFSTPGTFLITLQVSGTNNGFPVNIFDQRVVTVLQQSTPFPPAPIPGQSPIGFGPGITAPVADQVITLGEFVDFEALRISNADVNYNWNFGVAQGQTNRRNPAPVQFTSPGSHVVSVQITGRDVSGLPINIYDQRVITVLQQALGNPPGTSPFPGTTPIGPSPIPGSGAGPEGYITLPTTQFLTVRRGEAIQFSGTGFDPQGNGELSFQWSFGGTAGNVFQQNPGFITFDQPGTFAVTLLVQNAFGQADLTPPSVIVQVLP